MQRLSNTRNHTHTDTRAIELANSFGVDTNAINAFMYAYCVRLFASLCLYVDLVHGFLMELEQLVLDRSRCVCVCNSNIKPNAVVALVCVKTCVSDAVCVNTV